jgi:hypothetical protein
VIAVILALAPSYFEPYLHLPGVAVGVGAIVLYVPAAGYVIHMTWSRPTRRRQWRVQLEHRCGEPRPADLAVEVSRDDGRARRVR